MWGSCLRAGQGLLYIDAKGDHDNLDPSAGPKASPQCTPTEKRRRPKGTLAFFILSPTAPFVFALSSCLCIGILVLQCFDCWEFRVIVHV